jgi:catechol 2,3-dioxygenase-like lactoylglutathione lyase family enzyme
MPSIIDHISLTVSDYARAKAFYVKALAPLGVKALMEFGEACGFGKEKPDFWIGTGPAEFQKPEHVKLITPQHIAFVGESRAQVEAFYKAAIAAGARDNGKPGIREQYHPKYYGAFVLDFDGHNIEAVFHGG